MKNILQNVDWSKWSWNMEVFLAPLGIIYVGSVIAMLHANQDIFTLSILVPDPLVQGAMVLYVLNSVLDLLKKINTARKLG